MIEAGQCGHCGQPKFSPGNFVHETSVHAWYYRYRALTGGHFPGASRQGNVPSVLAPKNETRPVQKATWFLSTIIPGSYFRGGSVVGADGAGAGCVALDTRPCLASFSACFRRW
jgi:hypothetical protein